MQLFLMRHGEAGFDAASDRERTLTDSGRYQTRAMAAWLAQQVHTFDLVLVSPYLRAQQTWQEMKSLFSEPQHLITLHDIIPSSDAVHGVDIILAYAEQHRADKVLVLSHMPLLGYLVAEMAKGTEPPMFATSAVTLIDYHLDRGSVSWHQSPQTIA